MEEKKLDLNSIIGFILIFGILVYMMYTNQPTPEEIEAEEKAKQEQVDGINAHSAVGAHQGATAARTESAQTKQDDTLSGDVQRGSFTACG